MPLVQMVIMAIISAIFSPAIVNGLMKSMNILQGGGTPELTLADITNGIAGVMAQHAASPSTPGAVAQPAPQPTAAQIVNNAVKDPPSLFGIAAIGFVGVFVISQLRAAGHEMTTTTKELYGEGQRVSKSLANPDTTNISRRAKG